VNTKKLLLACALLLGALGYGCSSQDATISGRVYFNSDQPDPLPAVGVKMTLTDTWHAQVGGDYMAQGFTNEKGEFRFTGIYEAGDDYAIVADYSTATNIPEGFQPVMAEANGKPVPDYQPGSYVVVLQPIDIKVGDAPTHLEDVTFLLLSF
jgi:hypothetical protein